MYMCIKLYAYILMQVHCHNIHMFHCLLLVLRKLKLFVSVGYINQTLNYIEPRARRALYGS